jgi:hypothetical protein
LKNQRSNWKRWQHATCKDNQDVIKDEIEKKVEIYWIIKNWPRTKLEKMATCKEKKNAIKDEIVKKYGERVEIN